ncbi:hypothetical protein [Prescottella agglutinans]|uniref:Uncharacterized protein n=1 Tax=Prescottella agglutinans TaxID=1644129 RepID=A0ABT6MKN1_9NOCA|nr:hypothetical protein [Prescottella agglutinans]MDH6284882.1 hypothetical protein [Prescottella agglutinans]
MRKRSKSEPVSASADHFGYSDLRIPETAARTKKLQAILCAAAEVGGNVDDVDRTAILGLMQIVGELEAGLRTIANERS